MKPIHENPLLLAAALNEAGIGLHDAVQIADDAAHSTPTRKRKTADMQRGSLLMHANILRHRAEKIHAELHRKADAIEFVVAAHYPESAVTIAVEVLA